MAHLALAVMALVAAWRPVESHAGTAVLLTAAVLLLVPWTWSRTPVAALRPVGFLVFLWTVFILFGQAGGWDRSQALVEVFLIAGIFTAVWIGSREAPRPEALILFALGVAGLAAWGLLQTWGGLESVRPAIEDLPEHLKAGALARVDQRRAFASLFLPSHLSVLLATALPLLVCRIRRDALGAVCAAAGLLVVAGLVATRSPVGGLLAVAACASVLFSVPRRKVVWIIVCLACVCILGAGLRPDVMNLEPVALRLDNWRSALWVFSTSPIAGVGLGGFSQAAQAFPGAVGNHPLHAHSMPFELLAEGGLFGLCAVFLLAGWLVRTSLRLWDQNRGLAVALLVVPAHNLVDFSLHTAGVALPWAVLFGWCLAAGRPAHSKVVPPSKRLRLLPVVAATVGLGLALLGFSASHFLRAAQAEETTQKAFAWAVRAAEVAPWSLTPVDTVGAIALETGDAESVHRALGLVRSRRWQRPRSAARAQLTGRLAIAAGDAPGGLSEMWRASELQPFDSRSREEFEALVELVDRESR